MHWTALLARRRFPPDAKVIDDIFASKRDLKHVDMMMDRALADPQSKE